MLEVTEDVVARVARNLGSRMVRESQEAYSGIAVPIDDLCGDTMLSTALVVSVLKRRRPELQTKIRNRFGRCRVLYRNGEVIIYAVKRGCLMDAT